MRAAAQAEDELLVIIPDLDGDGRSEALFTTYSGRTVVQRGWPEGVRTELGYRRSAITITASVGDLNGDGVSDLVLSSAWEHRVEVYFGPFDGRTKPTSEAFRLQRDPGGGLADLFGAATLIEDLDGDGHTDLLVTAPSEGEEACSGVRPTLVFRGPLAAGPGSTVDGVRPVGPDEDDGPAAAFMLPATVGRCLGDEAAVVVDGARRVLLLSEAPARGYVLPLTSSSMPLPTTETPALPRHETRFDVDGDGRAEPFGLQEGRLGWQRSSDGAVVLPRYGGYDMQALAIDLDHDGLGAAWVFHQDFESPEYRSTLRLFRVPTTAMGIVEFTALSPEATVRRSSWIGIQSSQGDLDGDGIDEVAIANVLLRVVR